MQSAPRQSPALLARQRRAPESRSLSTVILFGVYENGSGPAFLMALPEIVWEASVGIYAAWKGFRPSPITKRWAFASRQQSPVWRWLSGNRANALLLSMNQEAPQFGRGGGTSTALSTRLLTRGRQHRPLQNRGGVTIAYSVVTPAAFPS